MEVHHFCVNLSKGKKKKKWLDSEREHGIKKEI